MKQRTTHIEKSWLSDILIEKNQINGIWDGVSTWFRKDNGNKWMSSTYKSGFEHGISMELKY